MALSKDLFMKAKELIALGLLDPRKELTPRIISNAEDEFNVLIKQPWYKDMFMRMREGGFEDTTNMLQANRRMVMPEDLQGNAMVYYKTDASDLGNISQYGGLPTNVDVESGTKYTPFGQEGWMSMDAGYTKSGERALGMAGKAHRNARDIERLTEGRPVTAMSTLMGQDSSLFSTPAAELMLSRINEANMPSNLLDYLDKQIRASQTAKQQPWVGIRSQDALNQITGEGGFDKLGAGAMRHNLYGILSSPEMRKRGMPQPHTVLRLIDNPDYQGLDYGSVGMNMWTPDTARDVYDVAGAHKSYSTKMPRVNDELTGAEYPVPISFAAQNPEGYAAIRARMTDPKPSKKTGKTGTPRNLTHNEAVNTFTDSRPSFELGNVHVMNQQSVDSASAAIEHNLKLVAKYGSLPAAIAAGETMASTGGEPSFGEIAQYRKAEQAFADKHNALGTNQLSDYEKGRLNYFMPDTGTVEAPNSAYRGVLDKAGMSLQNLETPLGKPFEGTAGILHDMAYGDAPDALDAVFAPLELAGGVSNFAKNGLLSAFGADKNAQRKILEGLLKEYGY